VRAIRTPSESLREQIAEVLLEQTHRCVFGKGLARPASPVPARDIPAKLG
jgi:hypothetical protein